MIISRKHKFVFVHIPKTGGTTVTLLLQPHLKPGPRNGKAWQVHYHKHKMHSSIKPFRGSEDYFKFAFVRNPWSWLVSQYTSGVIGKRYNHGGKKLSWPIFLGAISRQLIHVEPQIKWLKLNNKIAVDYVARFENFTDEIKFIFNRLKLKYNKIPHRLKQRNAKHYTEWYNDSQRKIVAQAFKSDIKKFKYEFGA